jgi:hypothetical protein
MLSVRTCPPTPSDASSTSGASACSWESPAAAQTGPARADDEHLRLHVPSLGAKRHGPMRPAHFVIRAVKSHVLTRMRSRRIATSFSARASNQDASGESVPPR